MSKKPANEGSEKIIFRIGRTTVNEKGILEMYKEYEGQIVVSDKAKIEETEYVVINVYDNIKKKTEEEKTK